MNIVFFICAFYSAAALRLANQEAVAPCEDDMSARFDHTGNNQWATYGSCAKVAGIVAMGTAQYNVYCRGTYHNNQKYCKKTCKMWEIDNTCSDPSLVIATVNKDPHVTNMRNENFDIMSLGQVSLVKYPREGPAKLVVHALIEKLGEICYETYMRNIVVSGSWLDTNVSFQVVNDHLQISTANEWKTIDDSFKLNLKGVDFQALSANNVKMSVGQTKFAVWTEKNKQWSYLNLEVSGLSTLVGEVGGLLGLDDHSREDQQHAQCVPKKGKRLFRIFGK